MTFPYRWLVRAPRLMRAFVLLEVAWTWSGAVAPHRSLARRYPANYRLVRFDDLVRAPEEPVDCVCADLGVAPESHMLRQKVTSTGRLLGQVGFDVEAADRWRATIAPGDARRLRRLLGRRYQEMGYPRSQGPSRRQLLGLAEV